MFFYLQEFHLRLFRSLFLYICFSEKSMTTSSLL